jgi:glycerophosphoryl diester phosphodiesterase
MQKPPLLLGHRGARLPRSAGENTIAAFDLALRHGCDGFEFDVRLTADGVTVVCHDPKIAQTVIGRTPAAQLKKLPTLESVMARYVERAFLDIELKVPGMARGVLSAIDRHQPARGYVVSSFQPEVLTEVRAIRNSAVLGYICNHRRTLALWRELECEYVIPHQRLVSRELIKQVHARGKKILVWTVNAPIAMNRLAGWGIDGVISDDPELLSSTLAQRSPGDEE